MCLSYLAGMFDYNCELLQASKVQRYPPENDFSKLSKFLICPVIGQSPD